jgi:hypothetical protein
MWTSEPQNGVVYVATPSLLSSRKVQWWRVGLDPSVGPELIGAHKIPKRIRMRAYRKLWNQSHAGLSPASRVVTTPTIEAE